MLNLWKQTSENFNSSTPTRPRSPDNGNDEPDDSPPPKKRKTGNGVTAKDLPRPVTTTEDVFKELSSGNVITVVESREEKLDLLKVTLGQSIVARQSAVPSSKHRTILFVVDDNFSIQEYTNELEEMYFQVGSYTVALHSSESNGWPTLIYNDIIVVTANMLLDSLAYGNINLSQAHLMVISDAQRIVPTITPHPVLRIISDYHSRIPDPPRILATFTCSTDHWGSLDLSWLETSSRARTFFLETPIVEPWTGPTELVVEYDPQPNLGTPLSANLRKVDPEWSLILPCYYRRASRIFKQLGSFAAELYWRNVSNVLLKGSKDQHDPVRAGLEILTEFNVLKPFVISTNPPTFNASSKFIRLLQILRPCVNYGDHFRGIIFVKDRAVAIMLVELLQLPDSDLPFVKASVLDRSRRNVTLRAFTDGGYNLLVLTKSSEDIDMHQASIVINFDLFEDQLSYAYSHASTKGQHSHLVYMAERGNNEHRQIIRRTQAVDDDLRTWISNVRSGTNGLPPATIYIGLDPYRSDSEDEEDSDFITDPVTNAKLYKHDSTAAIYRFIAEVPSSSSGHDGKATLTLGEGSEGNGQKTFHCTLSFPSKMMLPTFAGPFCSSRWEARREACYYACERLVRWGLMSHRHFPQSRTLLPNDLSVEGEPTVSQDIKTANTSAQTHGYPRKTPDFWRVPHPSLSPTTTLFPTIITPECSDDSVYASVALLTLAPLPRNPDFSLFYNGQRIEIRFAKAAPLEVTDAKLRVLHDYTLRTTCSLINKNLDGKRELGSFLCYFAPLDSDDAWRLADDSPWPPPNISPYISWDKVTLAAASSNIPLVDNTTSIDEQARDAIVVDRNVHYTMRHFVVKVRHDLTPLSKVEDSLREAEFPNFLEYCKERGKDVGALQDVNQPMIEVSAVPGMINNLHPTAAPPPPSTKVPLKYLIPELCYKFTIPASTYRTLWLVPSILDRIDSYLITKELNARLFQNTMQEQLLLTALYSRAAWTELNYERLEFLGDSFLKVLASNFCYATAPGSEAGELHVMRQGIISNKVLQEAAARVGLPSYIQHTRFVAKAWQPPMGPVAPAAPSPAAAGIPPGSVDEDVQMADASPGAGDDGKEKDQARGRRSKKQRQQDAQHTLWMGDKVVADVVEAVLAAAFLSGSKGGAGGGGDGDGVAAAHEAALRAARSVGIPVPNVARWADFARLRAEHAARVEEKGKGSTSASAGMPGLARATAEQIERVLGVSFARPELLGQALTHMSVSSGGLGANYDRLEFIGDAVLDFLVSRHIWDRHPHLSPGGLTMLKAAMVSNQTLAAFCVHAGLHQYTYLESGDLKTAIQKYIGLLAEARTKEHDSAEREHRLPGQYWLEVSMEPPKILSDVVEAIVGALYVGDNFQETNASRFFHGVFKQFLDAHVRLQTLSKHPRVTLLELLQAEGCQNSDVVKRPAIRQNTAVLMEVVIHGQVVTSAMDPSAEIATRRASLQALDMLASDPGLLARMCDCKSGSSKKGKGRAVEIADSGAEAGEVEAAKSSSEEI